MENRNSRTSPFLSERRRKMVTSRGCRSSDGETMQEIVTRTPWSGLFNPSTVTLENSAAESKRTEFKNTIASHAAEGVLGRASRLTPSNLPNTTCHQPPIIPTGRALPITLRHRQSDDCAETSSRIGRCGAIPAHKSLEKRHQCTSGLVWLLLQQPVSAALDHDRSDIRSGQLHLTAQKLA